MQKIILLGGGCHILRVILQSEYEAPYLSYFFSKKEILGFHQIVK